MIVEALTTLYGKKEFKISKKECIEVFFHGLGMYLKRKSEIMLKDKERMDRLCIEMANELSKIYDNM